jgi:hypothetical protein
VEADKGGISDAFKRAAVKWGIGRYLYDLKSPWVPCESRESGGKKYWKSWKVDPWTQVRNAPKPPEPAKAPAPVDREAAARDWKNSQIAKLDKWKKDGKFDNIHAWPDAPNTAAFLATLKQDFPPIYESVMAFWQDVQNHQTPISVG